MNTYVALLRGINVGGKKKVAMADLRELLGALGHSNVSTLLQSGNAVFTSIRPAERVRAGLEARIKSDLGLAVKVFIRTPDELAAVVDANPLPQAARSPSQFHVAFLSKTPAAGLPASIDPTRFEPDEFRFGNGVIYLWYPNGMGRSKMTNGFFERELKVDATTRNWNTVTKLLGVATALNAR